MARILLVDDNTDILDQCKTILSVLNHDILTAKDGLEALDILYSHIIDVVVLDISMPHLNGYELVRRIKRSPRFKTVELAVLTGRTEPADLARCLSMGIQKFLTKPVQPEVFLETIKSLIPRVPDSRTTEVNFVRDINAMVTVEIEAEILTMSELGIVIATNTQFELHQTLKICSTVFDNMGLGKSVYFYVDCINSEGDHWVTRLLFRDLFGCQRENIRKYISQTNNIQ